MFIHHKTGIAIHADPDRSVSTATLRTADLASVFLNVIRDAPEYGKILSKIPGNALHDPDHDRWDNKGSEVLTELFDLLDSYSPEGYAFGSLPDDGADFGFWKDSDDPEESIPVLTLSRNDLSGKIDVSGLTDETLKEIARMMGEIICDYGAYENGMETAIRMLNLR